MIRLWLVAILCFVALLAVPSGASAATCSDYDTQKEAQQNADTRDGDGDGIYCESLPCPCLKPGQDDGGEKPKKKRTYVYKATITKVVDGDTLKVKIRGKTKTLRVIGIDTPESKKPGVPIECGALAASSNAWEWAFSSPADSDGDGLFDSGTGGRRVKLKTDPSQDKIDKYGRLLVYVTRGSSNFAVSQLRAGWAMVYVYNNKPFKQVERFRVAEASAKSAGRGVWDSCGGDFHSEQ